MFKKGIFLSVFIVIISFFFLTNETSASVAYKNFYQLGGDGSVTIHNIKFDPSGNMYVVGYFTVTVDFNPGSGVSEVTSNGGEDMFIVKFDADENFVWVKTFGGISNDRAYGITFDGSEDLYITGFFADTVSFDATDLTSVGSSDIFIGKLSSSDGSVSWMYGFGGSALSETGRNIHYDADSGKIYIVGDYRGTVDFDPGGGTTNLTSNGNEDIFFLSLGTDGSFVWAGSIGAGSTDRAFGIGSYSGKIYLTGQFQGTTNFDIQGGDTSLTSAGSTDIFVARYGSDSSLEWVKRIGDTSSDIGYELAVDENQDVYVVGQFTGTVDFDPNAGTENKTAVGGTDGFFLKLDSNGDFVWAKAFGGSGTDFTADIVLEDTSAIYINGGFQDTVDFDPGVGEENKTSAGDTDLFVLKLDYATGDFVWVGAMGGSSSQAVSRIAFNENNIYSTGSFLGTADFDPSSTINNKTVTGGQDGYISVITFVPYLTEVTPIVVSVYPNTLSYTFNTDEGGTISYGGSCSSLTTSTVSGNKTVNFSQLSPGTYSNCTITVTDSDSNVSNTLAVSPFTIVVHSGGGGGSPSPLPVPPISTPPPTPIPEITPNPEPEIPSTPTPNTYTSPIDGSSKSCPGFTKYLKKGNKLNDKEETRLWQAFLNKYQNEKLKVDGLYGNLTEAGIKRFQNTYKQYILTPWNLKNPTGYTYQSTRAYANKIVGCSEGLITLDNGKIINY